MILAQLQPELDWSSALKTLVGIVGLLMVVWLVFSVAIAWKKLFGRRPPIGDELDKLEARVRSEIMDTYSRAFKNAEEAKLASHAVRAEMDERFEKLNQDRQRSLAGINQAFRDIERGLGRLEGKTE